MEYVIVTLTGFGNGSGSVTPVFWRRSGAGFTLNPFEAGLYSAEEIAKWCILGVDDFIVPVESIQSVLGLQCEIEIEKISSLFTGHHGGLYKERLDDSNDFVKKRLKGKKSG